MTRVVSLEIVSRILGFSLSGFSGSCAASDEIVAIRIPTARQFAPRVRGENRVSNLDGYQLPPEVLDVQFAPYRYVVLQ